MSIPASWFIQILNMSLGAAWAALLVMAARLLLRKAPKRISYALWAVVLFRLVCPVSFTSVLSLMPRPQTIPQEIVYAPQPAIQSGFQFLDQAVNPSLPPATPEASINPVQLWLEVGNLLWQAGAVLLLLYCVLTYLRFRRRLETAVLREGNIWESDRIPTAFVLGFFRPRIYLPLGLGEEERQYILCHERTHIRRLDHLVKPLALLLLCVHWFNPVLWAAYFLMCRDMEMSCDEQVMEQLGTEIRKGYSASLLAISERQSGLISPLAFGENDVKSRIKNVLRYKKPALWLLVLTLVLAAALAFCLLADPAEQWIPLLEQEDLPYHGGAWAERIQVERQGSGKVLLEDPEQVRQLRELVTGLEVGKKPVPAKEENTVWELRLTFLGDGDSSAALCFTSDTVWGSGGRIYPLRESVHLFRVVEEYTFLSDPTQAGEYRVGFMEVRDGEAQPYLTITEPIAGSRLASLLLDGTLLEEKPGAVPPVRDYLFLNMGNPGTTYYVYTADGRYYMERPEDYRLELAKETYDSILSIWQTAARREAPDAENGYYTGFQEVGLRKFASYQAETATRLAELILSGKETPLILWDDASSPPDSLRIEIRSPENAYYLFRDPGFLDGDRYLVERPENYCLELTEDTYGQIRNLYLDAAMENITAGVQSFYAEGELSDIARVGIEGYFGAFTGEDIPEELRILRFTVGEITPMAGTPEEFAVSFLWDYDTPRTSRRISANGNGQPAQDFEGWHWTGNYQEFRFRRLQEGQGRSLYQIVDIGTGGGGQGLAPIRPQVADSPASGSSTASADPLARFRLESYLDQEPDNNFAPVDALCAYLKEHLTEDQYSAISHQRDSTYGRWITAQVATANTAPVEALLTTYPGEPAPVEYFIVPFSAAQLKEAEAAMKAFLQENPEIDYYLVGRFYDSVSLQIPEETPALHNFIEAYPVKNIFRLNISPNGLQANPDTAPSPFPTGQEANDRSNAPDKAEAELDRQAAAEYAAHGITKDGKNYYYQGQLVNVFLDQRANRSAYILEVNREGTLNLKVTRNAQGEIKTVAPMTEEEAGEILADREDNGAEMNPDTSPDPASMEILDRCNTLMGELYDALPLDAYNHFEAWCEGETIFLEIAVTDEAAVDRILNSWTGTRWDQMQKTDGLCSRAQLEEFVLAVNRLDFGPGASSDNAREDYGKAGIYVSYDTQEATDRAAAQGIPEAVTRLMEEMGIPAQLVDYGVIGYRAPPSPGTNPDT